MVLVVAAAVARFYDLPSDGLRTDEVIVALNAQGTFGELIENTRHHNTSPILYPIGLWLIEKIEVSSLSIRLAPALASTLTVAALVVLLPWAGVRRSVAFPAGVLMAVSVAAIYEARDAREYSLEALLTVIMMAGALWYLKGEKRWMLPTTLFSVAVVLMIVVKQGLDTNWGREQWMPGLRDIAVRAAAPVMALSAGSAIAWFSTLQYQRPEGGGWARESYLLDDYFQGRLTDIGAIFQFSYDKFEEILGYHVGIIPFFVLVGLSIASSFLSSHVRRSKITILFLMCMGIALIAAISGQYPLGSERQCLLWGPVIVLAFSQCVPATSELIARLTESWIIRVDAIACAATVLVLGCIGVLAITNDEQIYSKPMSFEIAIEIIENRKEPGDIVFWTEGIPFQRGTPFIELHYGGDIPAHYRLCDGGSCLDALLNLQKSKRLWVAVYNVDRSLYNAVNDIILLEEIANITGEHQFLMHKETGSVELYFIHESQVVLDLYRKMVESFPDILNYLGHPVLKRMDYDVYRSKSSLLYVTENCEEERPEFFMHIFPEDPDDLPARWKGWEYENQGFSFKLNSINLGGTCVALRALPEYRFSRIVTGQFEGEDRIWYGAIDFSRDRSSTEITRDFLDTLEPPVLTVAGWDVYLSDRDIIWMTDDTCEFSVDTPPFFFHVYPVEVGDLPAESQPHGFENRDFHSPDYASAIGGGVGCVVVRALPAYPVSRIETGQYITATGEKIWRGVIEGELVE